MPNCIQLTTIKGNEPVSFTKIDNEMREHFGEPPSKNEWLEDWYNIAGLAMAMGHDFAWCKENMSFKHPIIEYLEARYNVDAWYER